VTGSTLKDWLESPVGLQSRIGHGHYHRYIGIDVNVQNQAYKIAVSKVQVK
jgi:hypothetical protein